MQSKDKIVYTCMSADLLHVEHVKIIEQSVKLGKVILGLMTDESIISYKRVPVFPYESRKRVLENIKGIWKIVPQKTLDYTENLRKYKPDIVTNGEDWIYDPIQSKTRKDVIKVLSEWGGKVIDFKYTPGVSSTLMIEDFRRNGVTPEQRRSMLKRLISIKSPVRVMEAHNGLSALIVENARVNVNEFDAIWESSLTDSASKGKPDIELIDFTSRIQTINEILEVTTKPVIVDGDTGGLKEHFVHVVRTLERLGVSAIILEDKKFPKRNSLLEKADHIQEDPVLFGEKIEAGVRARITRDFMIIARIESLILGKPLDDALERAKIYIKHGADAIMIHSKKKTPTEVISFCKKYNKIKNRVPLIVVPTTYNSITEHELRKLGVNVVIYANHLLRSSYKAMERTAKTILEKERSKETDVYCYPVSDLLKLIDSEKIKCWICKKEIKGKPKKYYSKTDDKEHFGHTLCIAQFNF